MRTQQVSFSVNAPEFRSLDFFALTEQLKNINPQYFSLAAFALTRSSVPLEHTKKVQCFYMMAEENRHLFAELTEALHVC